MPLLTGIIAERFGFDGGMSAIMSAFVMLTVLAVLSCRYRKDDVNCTGVI